jgi:hypothetical protein
MKGGHKMREDIHKVSGCVIISDEKRSYGVVELLAQRVRSCIELTHYAHPHEIDLRRHRFVIVFSLRDLALVIKTFVIKAVPVPLLIHIDAPDIISQTDYAVRFPDIAIAPIEQANLTDKEGTLKIALFQEIIESVALSEAHDTSQQHVDNHMEATDRINRRPVY